MAAIEFMRWNDPTALEADVAAKWLRAPGSALPLSGATQAYLPVLEILTALGKPSPRVWIPDYYCESALIHLRARGIALEFYPITETMEPDWAQCARLAAAAPPPDLFVLTHYFGTANAVEAARQFCDAQGCLLLEDAVHVLLPVGPIGTKGDFVIYSPRKFLALPDGALLLVHGDSLVNRARSAVRALPPHRPSTLAWSIAALRRRRRVDLGPLPPIDMDYDYPNPVPPSAIWMSRLAKALIARKVRNGDVESVMQREIRERVEVESSLAGWHGLTPLPTEPGAVPYLFALRGTDHTAVATALSELRQAGAMAGPWPALPPEVRANPDKHRVALQIRRTLLRFYPRASGRRRPVDFLKAMSLPLGADAAPQMVDHFGS